MEIERKFLVAEPPDLTDASADEVEQGYLAVGSEGEVRVRSRGGGRLLTVKRGAGLSRDEAEVELTEEQFEALWPLTEGRRVRKRRYTLSAGEVEIELDVYAGDHVGLTVAEVEFGSEDEARRFQPPPWFGEEVTGDERYLNESLAVAGSPP